MIDLALISSARKVDFLKLDLKIIIIIIKNNFFTPQKLIHF